MKTIKELAAELEITKAGLRKYLTEDIRKQYTETVSGVIYISETGEKLIKSAFDKNKPETTSDTVTENQAETVSSISDTVSVLVATLQKELEVKNKQIEGLQESNRELTQALENTTESLKAAQMLHAGTMQQALLPDGEANTNNTDKAKVSLWSRIFKRKEGQD